MKDLVFVFRGPAHVMVEASDPEHQHYVGRPMAETRPQGSFYEYLTMVMDRVYITGQPEMIEIVTATYKISRWLEDGLVGGVAVTVQKHDYPKGVLMNLMALRSLAEV